MIDVAIVGGGPAGLTAAIYLRRFHRSCVVLDSGASRARWIPESNNCPGFPGGVSGVELLRRLRAQADEVSVSFHQARVERVVRVDGGFEVSAQEGSWRARRVMFATGLSDRLPGEWAEQAIARGALRLCPICDAYEVSDLRIGVFGRGAQIGAHARFLRAYSATVFALPCDGGDGGEEGARAREDGVHWLGRGDLHFDGERCLYSVPERTPVPFDTVYSYLGAETSAGIAAAAGVQLTEEGEIPVDRHQQTCLDGLYAIGDVVSGLNQIAVAVGQAAVAATHAHNHMPFVARTPMQRHP